MVAHGFTYRSYPRVKHGVRKDILRPTVSFTIQLPGGEAWSEDALIDSGSPACLFTHQVGEAIGVRFGRSGAEYENFEILGRREAAQMERVHVTLGHWPDLSWEMDAWFFLETWDWKLQVGGIFGTEGFLTEWIVTFLRPFNMFVVASLDSIWRLERGPEGKPVVRAQAETQPQQLQTIDPLDPEEISPLLQYQEEWDVP